MRFKINPQLKERLLLNGVVILIVAIVITTYFHFGIPGKNPSSSRSVYYEVINSLPPIDPELPVDTPHKIYERLKFEAQQLRDLKNGDFSVGNYVFGGLVGFYTAIYCDSCSFPVRSLINIGERKSYLKLAGWRLGNVSKDRDMELLFPNDFKFFVKNGQSYLRKKEIVRSDTNLYGTVHHKIKMADIAVKFRYSRQDGAILIPFSTSNKFYIEGLVYGFTIVMFGWILYGLYTFLGLIVGISKRFIFTDRNLWALNFLGWSLLCYPVVMVLLNLLLRLLFNNYFSDEVELNPEIWANWQYKVIGGLVFLLLSRAFRKGKQLQEEADLTV